MTGETIFPSQTVDATTEATGTSPGAASTSSTRDGIVPLASGKGGTSDASGCITVWVRNVGHTALGFTSYWFTTYTHACYNRAKRKIWNPSNWWKISHVDGQEYWQGIINKHTNYYSWLSGHPRSGYHHYRQGKFENCILKYGCISTSYPANNIWLHSNSTWKWSANGAA